MLRAETLVEPAAQASRSAPAARKAALPCDLKMGAAAQQERLARWALSPRAAAVMPGGRAAQPWAAAAGLDATVRRPEEAAGLDARERPPEVVAAAGLGAKVRPPEVAAVALGAAAGRRRAGEAVALAEGRPPEAAGEAAAQVAAVPQPAEVAAAGPDAVRPPEVAAVALGAPAQRRAARQVRLAAPLAFHPSQPPPWPGPRRAARTGLAVRRSRTAQPSRRLWQVA